MLNRHLEVLDSKREKEKDSRISVIGKTGKSRTVPHSWERVKTM